jgi:hypothetical protein
MAKQARLNAESQHRNVERQWPLIRLMAHKLRKERHDNHFAERMRAAFEGDS